MKWILLQKSSRFVPFFFTPFLELNLLLENNSVLIDKQLQSDFSTEASLGNVVNDSFSGIFRF